MAKLLARSIVIETDYTDWKRWQEREAAALSEASETLRKAKSGDLVGKILRWQRADGYAQYMVVSEKPLVLVHLAVGDGWQIEDALIRGLRLADVREMVRRDRAMEKLFSKT